MFYEFQRPIFYIIHRDTKDHIPKLQQGQVNTRYLFKRKQDAHCSPTLMYVQLHLQIHLHLFSMISLALVMITISAILKRAATHPFLVVMYVIDGVSCMVPGVLCVMPKTPPLFGSCCLMHR